MKVTNKREPFILFLGDIVCFVTSLWLMLYFRTGSSVATSGSLKGPSLESFEMHLAPFSIVFVSSVLIFYISGLYEKHNSILRSKLPSIIIQSQIANSIVAVLFFYFIPYFGITPKTNLFIYLLISVILVSVWRLVLYPYLLPGKKKTAMIIGSGVEMEQLIHEVNGDPHYDFTFSSIIDISNISIDDKENIREMIRGRILDEEISMIVLDLDHPEIKKITPKLFDFMFLHIDFIPMYTVYEHVFDRIPYSALQHDWFIEHVSATTRLTYSLGKRLLDILVAGVAFIISLIFYPFIWLAIKIEDRGPLFVVQERIGQGNRKFRIYKFRSMRQAKSDGGVWVGQNDARITKVGRILRKTSIDELPQLWSVIKGDLSLIGPRPDIYDLGTELLRTIPYYSIRSLIKPGLSGWAQVKQELPPQSFEETKLRLAYDIFYVKNRSLFLDLMIVLKTVRALFSRINQ